MTPNDCQILMDNIEIIRHVANGGMVQHALHDYNGNFIKWGNPQTKVLIPCLGRYRIYKPRIRVTYCQCCSNQERQCATCGRALGDAA